MRYLIWIVAIFLAGQAWGNPLSAHSQAFGKSSSCYQQGLSFKSIPHERPSTITLEARRVKSFRGELIFYDLGKETITIKPKCAAAKRFVADVSWGRCSAKQTVLLKPIEVGPFNTDFVAVRPEPSLKHPR